MPQPVRYHALDALRCLFISIIILYHFRYGRYWCEGGYAVEFFFIVSGFFAAKCFNPQQSFLSYAHRIIYKLLPFLIAAVIIDCVYKGAKVEPILNTLFLNPVFIVKEHDLFIGAAWFLNVRFWLLLALFYGMKVIERRRLNGLVGLLVFWACYMMLSANIWLAWEKVGTFLQGGLLRGIVGIGAGYLLAQLPCHQKMPSVGCATLAEGALLIYTVGAMFIQSWYIGPEWLFLSSIALIYLFTRMNGLISRGLNHPIFSRVSRYIPAVFLTHVSVTGNIVPFFNSIGISTTHLVPLVIFVLIWSWVFGIGIYYATQWFGDMLPSLCKKHLTRPKK